MKSPALISIDKFRVPMWIPTLALGILLGTASPPPALGEHLLAQAGDLGQEMRRIQDQVRDPQLPPPRRQPTVQIQLEPPEEEAAAAEEESEALAEDMASEVNEVVEEAKEAPEAVDIEAEEAMGAVEQPLEDVGAEAEDAMNAADEAMETEPADDGDAESGEERGDETAGEAGEDAADTPARPTRRASRADSEYEIKTVTIEGDKDVLVESGLLEQLEQEVAGQTFGEREIRDIGRRYNGLLVEQGYYLARMFTPPAAFRKLSDGELVLEVDKGRVGTTTFYEMKDGERVPFNETYFSEKQLRRRLAGLDEGEAFRYHEFYQSVFTVNSHPDLTMDTDLKVRRDRVDERQARFVDMEFTIKERLPLHGVFEIQNSGTEETEEWRVALTLQHLNLTKHDDVLTLTLPASIDFSTIRSLAASYYLPHHWRKGGALTLYGGYSQLEADQLVADVDLEGEGWFAGFQGTQRLLNSDRHLLSVGLGYAYQVIEDTLVLGGAIDTPRNVTIAPISFVLNYSSVRPDRLWGRNFLYWQSSVNLGGTLGSSDDDEFQLQRQTAEADYYIQRIQYARIQPVAIRTPEPGDEGNTWILFLKLDGQLASGPLIPAEQKAVGGLDNVRGYFEREVLGDDGVSGTLELRSPIWSRDITGKMFGDRNTGGDRLQLVFFTDFAQMYLQDTLEGIEDNIMLWSVGPGLRFAVTKYVQMKIDYGFVLEKTALSDSGRLHISLEAQF